MLIFRHLVLKEVRQWFYSEGFIEIQPPVSSTAPIPESSVELFKIEGTDPPVYLLPSPEVHLKPLLSLGLEKFFAICPAFRKNERGSQHLPEFTILEWYRAHAGYEDLITDCQELIASVCKALPDSTYPYVKYGNNIIDLTPPFDVITVREAFLKFAGWDPIKTHNEKRFDHDMVLKVEPALSRKGPVFLKDFPAWAASLSRLHENNQKICQRVEFFAGGLELANGFSELLEPVEQELRFQEENKKRKLLGLSPLPIPTGFLVDLEKCPPSAGIALGIDRLLMFLSDSHDIQQVTPA